MPAPRRFALCRGAAFLVLLFAGGCSPHPSGGDATALLVLRRSVVRTLDAGSARLAARVVPDQGPAVLVEGVTSLVAPEAHVTAKVLDHPGVPPAEVRVTAEGAWLLPPGATEWTAVDPALAQGSPARSWSDLLRALARATSARGRRPLLTATVDGQPVRVGLDQAGRITSIERRQSGTAVELRLSDFGVEVGVVPPPGS